MTEYKAGRARFSGEWEEVAARLRKRLAESVSDVASAIVQAGAVEAPCSPPIGELIDPRADDVRCYALPLRGFQGRIGRASLPAGIVWTGLPAAMD